jgi:MFS family permease
MVMPNSGTQMQPTTNGQSAPVVVAPNAYRLLWAGFLAILASGIGFGIRGGILETWRGDFGFTAQQVGNISGAGLTGFCFGIIIGGLIADLVGYGKLVFAAFLFHVLSAFVTFSATKGMDSSQAYLVLYWGSFLFAVANGTLEAVANPLVATLFPHNRTHYLNILHASWPAGLVIGGLIGTFLGGSLSWQMQMAFFLVPTVLYGLMFFGQQFPRSEASQKGLSLGEMLRDVGVGGGLIVCFLLSLFFKSVFGPFFPAESTTPDWISYGLSGVLLIATAVVTNFSFGSFLLFVLFVTHALIGAVELGTDNWIQNITGNILDPTTGKVLFVFTSAIMFLLRFCADFIEKKIGLSPVGILLVCSILACLGLNLISIAQTTAMVFAASAVYAVGKTFFWPTMLAVASDRFPRTGAVAISIMGGIGMMSAGMLGGPGLGYFKDRYAVERLRQADPSVASKYEVPASQAKTFLPIFDPVTGLEGTKLGAIKAKKPEERTTEEQKVIAADLQGDRDTLKTDSLIPATMAVIYLLLLLYFKTIGGYKVVHIDAPPEEVR